MTSGLPYAEVIGDPIDHSKSPLIHKFWLEKLAIDGDYRATRVSEAELASFLQHRRADPAWRGCNVTMPLKLAAADLLNARGPVNLIGRHGNELRGDNTDVGGIIEPLRDLATKPGSAVILGSGGVLLSVLQALEALGFAQVTIVARSETKVRDLVGAGSTHWHFLPWGSPLPASDLLLNATPLGMAGQPALPYDAASVDEGGMLFEMIYNPLVTPLLADARRRGLHCVDGLQMLVSQAAPSFETLFGQPAPRQHDAELRALLTA